MNETEMKTTMNEEEMKKKMMEFDIAEQEQVRNIANMRCNIASKEAVRENIRLSRMQLFQDYTNSKTVAQTID